MYVHGGIYKEHSFLTTATASKYRPN